MRQEGHLCPGKLRNKPLVTGGKSPGWGQREVCLPWPPGCWGQISEKGSAALGQRFLWSRQPGRQDKHSKSEGAALRREGRGEPSLVRSPGPKGPRLGTICRCPPWVWAGGPCGWRDLLGAPGLWLRCLGASRVPIPPGPGYLLPASHYLQALSVLHTLTQFPWPVLQALSEGPLPLPPGEPSAPDRGALGDPLPP